MAHTDRHRPWWVQNADPQEQDFYWFFRSSSYGWDKISLYRFGCPSPNCPCRWVTDGKTPRADRRYRRHDSKRRARLALKGDYEAWDRHR